MPESSNNSTPLSLSDTQRLQLSELLQIYGPEGPKYTKTAHACLRRLLNDEPPGRITNKQLRDKVRAILYECLCLINEDGTVKTLSFNCLVHCPELEHEKPIKQSHRTLLSKTENGIVQIERQSISGFRCTYSS